MTQDLFQEEEGATPLMHEERLGLLPSYITQRSELNEVEQINLTQGDRWAFNRPREVLDVGKSTIGNDWPWRDQRTRDWQRC